MNENALKAALAQAVGEENVRRGEPLAAYTTFGIGGPADYLVIPQTHDAVRAVLAACRSAGVALRVLGLGSNVLVADGGVRGVVLRLANNFSRIEVRGCEVVAEAGATNAAVARAAQQAGLAGYEFASGIPGTVGGAAIMNAGAYGGEFKDVCTQVRCLTPEGALVEVSAEAADWGYRHSTMDDAGYLVVSATLRLTPDDPQVIGARMDDLARRRAEKQPLDLPSAGSTFKRPEGHFAGALIEAAGLRGCSVGGAQISGKHAGFVVNTGGATADDVRRLIADVQARVYAHAGVRLTPEVRLWGFEGAEGIEEAGEQGGFGAACEDAL